MRQRLSDRQRQQIFRAAEEQFSSTGLESTGTIAIAKAARTSEATLRAHLGTKQNLFRDVIERNSQDRLAALQQRFLSIPSLSPLECIASMTESTVLACVNETGNVSVMIRGLMEMPDFAAEVYRREIGAIEALWEREIDARFANSPVRTSLAVHVVPYGVHACMAFGFWLTALRHKPPTAQAHAQQYAEGLAGAARTVLSLTPGSVEPVGPGV